MARRSSKNMNMDSLKMLSWVVVVVGALNWGLVGLFSLNLVESLFGIGTTLTQVVYIIVGLAGLYSLWGMFTMKK